MSLCAQRMSSTRNPKQDLRPSQCETNRKRHRAHSHTHIRRYSSHTWRYSRHTHIRRYSSHTHGDIPDTHTAIFQSHTYGNIAVTHACGFTQSTALIGHPGHTRITATMPAQRPKAHQTRRRTNSHGAHAHNVDVMITMYAPPHNTQR